MKHKITIDKLHDLPPTVDLMTAAQILGLGRTKAYALARSGEFPCRLIRTGGGYRVPSPELLRLLGVEGSEASRTAEGEGDGVRNPVADASRNARGAS